MTIKKATQKIEKILNKYIEKNVVGKFFILMEYKEDKEGRVIEIKDVKIESQNN